MTAAVGWGLALGAGLLVSWMAYPGGAVARLRPLLMVLRSLATIGLVALVLDLPVGAARPPAPLVALDASASWQRGGDTATWRVAGDSAMQSGATEAVQLFGDSSRDATIPALPADVASLVAPVIQRAAAAGRPLVLVTDGALDDPEALQQAPAGSRVVVVRAPPVPDRALVDLGAPGEGRVGDTVTVQARVAADAAMPTSTVVRWLLDATVLGDAPVPALAAGGEAVVERRVVIPPGDSIAVLHAVLATPDAEPRNDTLAAVFRRGARQRIVIVSTAPDADVRDVATALRSNVALPTDVYVRVAPGRWLRDNTLGAVEESAVRAAVRGATLAVLHGDTTVMGAPSSLGTRALLLLAPPAADAPELLVRTAPASPLQAALSGMVVESLPPLLATTPARGGVTALAAAPGLAATGALPIMSAVDGDVRRVVVTAAGYSRWRARGGVSEAAFQAFVGSATDWLLGARGGAATPSLMTAVIRAGMPVRWRRGAQPRSVLTLTRDGDRAVRRDSLVFGTGLESRTAPLPPGVWRGAVDGTAVVIPVSASREWLPHGVTVRSGPLNGAAVAERRGARSLSWLYLATVLWLAAEWLLRRRAGLR